jgi:8-oxo-dGTP diphosphatase
MSGQVIAGAVVAVEGRVLLVRRAVPVGELVWQFPAGKVDPGETLLEAAAREALEEAGVVVEPLTVIGERTHPTTSRRIVYVACRLLDGEARAASPREVAEVAWVRLGEIPQMVPGGCSSRCRSTSTEPRPTERRIRPRPLPNSGGALPCPTRCRAVRSLRCCPLWQLGRR